MNWPGQALTVQPVPDDRLPVDPYSGGVDDPNGDPNAIDPATGQYVNPRNPDGSLRVNVDGGFPGEIVTADMTPQPQPTDSGLGEQTARGLGLGARDVMNVAGSAADLVTLPITTIMRLIGVDLQPYKTLTNKAADAVGLPQSETGGEQFMSAVNEGAGLGMLTAGAGIPMSAARGVTGVIGETLAASPVADTISSAASMGAQNIAEQSGAGPLGQTVASLAGGVAGAAGAVGIPAAARRITQSTEQSDLLKAFTRQQVTPMADQVGGTGSRMASGVGRMTLGGIPLAEAAEKSIQSARAARDRIAGTMGRVTDDTGAGQAAQRGANTFIETSATAGGKLYDAIPIEGQRPAILSNTKQALAELNAGLESNPELSALLADARLGGYEAAIAGRTENVPTGLLNADGTALTRPVQKGGQLSWQDLKTFRSFVGEKAGAPSMQSDTSKAALQRLYAALSEDMKATAKAEGPKAERAFERANTFWRARQSRIDTTLTQILGKDFQKSPEAAFQQIERWSKEGGDSARIARTMRSLPDDEAATIRATLFSRMGNAPAGRQDITGDVFSPADFATQWAKLDSRAKAALFPGIEYRQSLDDIARIADAMKRSSEFANTSRTALAGNGIGLVTMALAGSPVTAGGIAATQYGFGSLMASPRFARWLASAPRKPNGPATLAHINRLGSIAAAEPVIANDVLLLQERLAQAFTQSPQSIAAEEPQQ